MRKLLLLGLALLLVPGAAACSCGEYYVDLIIMRPECWEDGCDWSKPVPFEGWVIMSYAVDEMLFPGEPHYNPTAEWDVEFNLPDSVMEHYPELTLDAPSLTMQMDSEALSDPTIRPNGQPYPVIWWQNIEQIELVFDNIDSAIVDGKALIPVRTDSTSNDPLVTAQNEIWSVEVLEFVDQPAGKAWGREVVIMQPPASDHKSTPALGLLGVVGGLGLAFASRRL